MGTNEGWPFNYWDDNKGPQGFAIEVLDRAAELAGYKLQWVHSKTGPEATFAREEADFWPFVTVRENREKSMYLSDPWWRVGTVLHFRFGRNFQRLEDMNGSLAAVTPETEEYLRHFKVPANFDYVVYPSTRDALMAMCAGKVDAAWVDDRLNDSILLNRPHDCEQIRIASIRLTDGGRRFAIGARFGREKEADRLRAAIDKMGENGELLNLASRYQFVQPSDISFLEWYNRNQRRSELIRLSLAGLAVLFAVSLVFMQRLQSARQQAERSARARSQFLANMSHEIRTPMNAILGMTEMTLDSPLNAAQREQLTIVRDSAKGLLTILNDILDFSRVESGKLSLEATPFSVRGLADRCIQMLGHAARAKGLELTLEIAEDLPDSRLGDPVRLQQVLINLLGNGIKFTEAGKVCLRVSASGEQHGPKAELEFSVSDTGIGIPADEHARIFRPFVQADSSTTRRFGGTGLGLSISAELTKRMGGKLELSSRPGEGSTFYFLVPLPLAGAPALLTPGGLEQQAKLRPQRKLSILIAEDNKVNRTLMERLLVKDGHATQFVEDGQQAIAALEGADFDAVLMDVQMPVMDGLEATRRIRERELQRGTRRVPILALTALSLSGDEQRCLDAGMDAYLSKPINVEELFCLLARFEAETSPVEGRGPQETLNWKQSE